MGSLIGPDDLQQWMDGKVLLGKDWSRGLLTPLHTFEHPLELWKYYVSDTDGVAGTRFTNGAGLELIPNLFDTSLRNRKQMPDNIDERHVNDMLVTHHSLLVERRAMRDEVQAHDFVLNSDVTGTGTDNLKLAEARVWYQLYIDNDESPVDEGLITEFPPGFGLEGDFTAEDMAYYRTGMNNKSVVAMLPSPVKLTKQLRAVLQPMHGALTFVHDDAASAAAQEAVGFKNFIYWFKNLPL
jgi:hypothetical protein